MRRTLASLVWVGVALACTSAPSSRPPTATRALTASPSRLDATPSSPTWLTYRSEVVGFDLEYPPDWAFRSLDSACAEGLLTYDGVTIANTDVVFPPEPPGCGRVWEKAGTDSVVMTFLHIANSREGPDPLPDTPFPLDLDDATPHQDELRLGPGTHRQLDVSIGGDSGYFVVVWTADGASGGDLDIAGRIVSSIAFPDGPVLEVPERLRKTILAEGTVSEGENDLPWSLLVYWRSDDGWCVQLSPLGLICEHEEEAGTTQRFDRSPFRLGGPVLARTGPAGGAWGTISGPVMNVRFEFEDGSVAEADVYSPPDELGVSFRVFAFTMTNMPAGRALALDSGGQVVAEEKFS